jgi:predicted Ser/Thr protein kinase
LECPDADTVAALVANELPESARAGIAEHAADCARCHAMLAALIADPTATPSDATFDDRGGEATRARGVVPGTRIGRYTVESRLGAGGMGVVYAAIDTELHRRVAIKLLRGDVDDRIGTQGRERLLREARTLASLSHPNVVTVYDVGTHAGDLFLAMELVDGGSLATWLRGASRSADDVVDRMIEAGRGLAAAHAAGVVHRDVKPDNVLVGRDGRARMTDFGLARSLDASPIEPTPGESPPDSGNLTRTGAVLGTPAYMAPEQVGGGRAIDARTDQWAFCATLYEAIAGVRPFPTDDLGKRTAAIHAGKIAAPAADRRVPSWVRPIVARGLRADPAARWPDVASVVTALDRGRKRRGRFVAIAAVAAVAVGAAAIGAFVLGRDDPPKPLALPSIDPYLTPDPRGCDPGCPYGICRDEQCVSSCTARAYQFSGLVEGISHNSVQDVLLGVTASGDAILYLTGKECDTDRLMIARRRGETYVPFDLTDQIDRGAVQIQEGCCTLTGDGKSIIALTPDQRGFTRVPLDGTKLGPADRREFDAIYPAVPRGASFSGPVIAHDQRAIYFVIHALSPGEKPSIHVAERRSTDVPFGTAERLRGYAQNYDFPTGITADGVSLFLTEEFGTRVLIRHAPGEIFAGPGGPALPSRLPGWRTVPLGDCSRMLTTYTPGGCHAEEIAWLAPLP